MACGWILDSGGAGRGAWQGGVLYELMAWARQHGGYPSVMMGASAGGYAAADVATTRCWGPAWLGLAELGSIILPPLATALAPAAYVAWLEAAAPPTLLLECQTYL